MLVRPTLPGLVEGTCLGLRASKSCLKLRGLLSRAFRQGSRRHWGSLQGLPGTAILQLHLGCERRLQAQESASASLTAAEQKAHDKVVVEAEVLWHFHAAKEVVCLPGSGSSKRKGLAKIQQRLFSLPQVQG